MQKLEITAYSVEEAKLEAFKNGITVILDATTAWRKEGSPILTKALNIFAANLLEKKKMFNFTGAGILISVVPGIKDKRKRPYALKNILRKGRCKLNRVIEIRIQDTDEVIAIASTKAEAITKSKQLISQYKKDLYGKTVYIADDIDFELAYVPSTSAEKGSYIVFGVEESDATLSKKRNRGLF